MTRSLTMAWAFSLLMMGSICVAGPNAGGVLVLHTNESLVYTESVEYCGQSGLRHCEDADTQIDGGGTRVFHILAAFPEPSSPRLIAVSFGLTYDDGVVSLIDHGSCGDEEVPMQGWPASGTGTGVGWHTTQTAQLLEVYWFACYVNNGAVGVLAAGPNPDLGGWFLDDDPIGTYDAIVDYGHMGFNTEGYRPCPPGPTPVRPGTWGKVKATFLR